MFQKLLLGSEFWLNHFARHLRGHLIIQRQLLKHHNNFWNLLKGDGMVNYIFLYTLQIPNSNYEKKTTQNRQLFAYFEQIEIETSVFATIARTCHYVKRARIAFILVRIFLHSEWIRISLRFQSECGKIRTKITPKYFLRSARLTEILYESKSIQYEQILGHFN